MAEILFRDLEVNNIPITECEVAFSGKYDNCRLYVVKEVETNSFWAKAVTFNRCDYRNKEESIWDNETLKVDLLLDVIAYWDGVRHINVTPQDECGGGYIYYPTISDLIGIFTALNILQAEICQEFEE